MTHKAIYALILICIVTASCANRHWTKEDTYRQGAATALLAIEWVQTKDLGNRYNEGYFETNPGLGKYPSQDEIDQCFAMVALGSLGIAYILPDPYRKYFQVFYIGYESNQIRHNREIGLRIEF